MHKRSKLLLAGFTAMLVFATAVGTASANRLSISNKAYRVTWSALKFEPGEVICPVTLEGSFHSNTINKVLRALIGYTSRAVVNSAACTGGGATILTETLPWHNQYGGFTGRLPEITGVLLNLVNASFQIRLNFFGITCLAKSTAENPAQGIVQVGAGGVVTGLQANNAVGIPLTGGCAFLGSARFSGTGTVTLLGAATAITIRLI